MTCVRLCICFLFFRIGASRAASLFRFSCMLNIWFAGARHVRAVGPCAACAVRARTSVLCSVERV